MKKSYRVVKIIDDTSLVVNAGSNDKIEKGDIMVISGKGEVIIDPITNESLGQIDIEKAKLEVIEVYEKMCICKSAFISNYMANFTSFSAILSGRYEKLDVNPDDITGKGEKTIKVGDVAIHIPKDVYEKINKKDKTNN